MDESNAEGRNGEPLSNAERQRRFRERKRLADESLPARQLDEEPLVVEGPPVVRARSTVPYGDVPDELLTSGQEQEIRDFWGYAGSETRGRAERQLVADVVCGGAVRSEASF